MTGGGAIGSLFAGAGAGAYYVSGSIGATAAIAVSYMSTATGACVSLL